MATWGGNDWDIIIRRDTYTTSIHSITHLPHTIPDPLPITNTSTSQTTNGVITSSTALTSHRTHHDPKRPKGYISAYNFYVMKQRNSISTDLPNLSVCNVYTRIVYNLCYISVHTIVQHNEVNRILGELWANLSPSQREVYEEYARKDKVRYWKVEITMFVNVFVIFVWYFD